MKLHLSNPSGVNSITAYGEGYVEINHRRHTTSLVVTPQALHLEGWAGLGFEQLAEDHFARLAQLKPEMVLLGTGAKLRFPAPAPESRPGGSPHRPGCHGHRRGLPYL